jgi:hypothetical protein
MYAIFCFILSFVLCCANLNSSFSRLSATKLKVYLILEDITHPFSRPSLIDIKMGTKTYEPDASPKKIAYERSKFSGQEELGFRFVGMKVG